MMERQDALPGRLSTGRRDGAGSSGMATVFDYLRMLRPSVLKQFSPEFVRLVNELPSIAKENRATVGRLFVQGGLQYATRGSDGRLHAQIRIPPGQMAWSPSITIMPTGGDLDLEFFNDDQNNHCAILPSNGDKQWLYFPVYCRSTAVTNLDGPGCYWFGSAIGNNEGRGLFGMIAVLGDVPQEARLDRPPQPRP